MVSSILGAFEGVKTKKKNKDDIQYIYYKDIRSAQKNRDTGDITELAEDIAEDGLDHNLVLRKIDDEDFIYEIVAGHRRYLAICHNIQNGDLTYEYIPAKIKKYDDVDAIRRLHLNNINGKPYTPGEMLIAIEDLKEVYRIKKERGEKVPGRVQELIAKDTGLGKTQVGNYEKVINNAIDSVKELVKNDKITLNEALKISEMDDDNQVKFIENANGDISLTTIAEYKDNLDNEINLSSNPNDENLNTDESIYCDDEFNETDDFENEFYESNSMKNNGEEEHKYSVQELIIEMQIHLHLLQDKIQGVEWEKEEAVLDNINELIEDLKRMIKI
ncbi:nucleoid occlusion protein [Thomasclavelia cocleata]|uniref:Nucleoid occlusion protein n=1 Tax=Thomasclavelia cocleata TaxID=69824 RepID=A0A829ZDF6_9FIRM|nr:ParB N-terminal domain-containing protein [Thomasclavelia cocleata]GFI41895.1 nucleoid occlusion protein [Thomasclavelia cocleata]